MRAFAITRKPFRAPGEQNFLCGCAFKIRESPEPSRRLPLSALSRRHRTAPESTAANRIPSVFKISETCHSIRLKNFGRKVSVFKSICIQTQASSKCRPEKLGHFGKFEDR